MRLSRKKQRRLIVAGAFAAGLLAVLASLPFFARESNCGGNSAALAACRSVIVCLRLITADRGTGPVSVTSLSPSERRCFEHVLGAFWPRDAKLLVTTSPVSISPAQPASVVAVCDRPFDNVPRRFFGKSPAAHAVAYANGRTGLLSPEAFQRLDLSDFVDVTSIPRLGGTQRRGERSNRNPG